MECSCWELVVLVLCPLKVFLLLLKMSWGIKNVQCPVNWVRINSPEIVGNFLILLSQVIAARNMSKLRVHKKQKDIAKILQKYCGTTFCCCLFLGKNLFEICFESKSRNCWTPMNNLGEPLALSFFYCWCQRQQKKNIWKTLQYLSLFDS